MSVTCARCRVRGARRAPRPPQTHINGCAGCSERHASARGAVRPGRGSAAPEARAQLATSAAAVEAPASAVDAFPRGDEWTIHKFGGTCVSAAERIAEAARVVVGLEGARKLVVVSAMGSHPTSPVKVTDLLLNMIAKAAARDDAFRVEVAALQEKHVATARALLDTGAPDGTTELAAFVTQLEADMEAIKAILSAISAVGAATEVLSDAIVGYGEKWCSRLFAAHLRLEGVAAAQMDASEVLLVEATADGQSVDVDYDASNARLDAWARAHGVPDVVVCTGFIASNAAGQVTTLRRNGSDYSATIFGALARAREIAIWTDVDGVFSADPRVVPEAACLASLTYHEAWELSYFGANVLHPRTTLPAMRYSIPVVIRNFFNLAAPGTRITALADQPPGAEELPVSGFATIEHVSLINVEGTGMQGIPGTAAAIFTALRDNDINVIMISQASSEHSLCFAVRTQDAERAQRVLRRIFADAMRSGQVADVERIPDCAVLAAVGQRMARNRGIAATVFDALAKAGVNIKAMAQGSSEYNITVLVAQADVARGLRAVHSRFFLSTTAVHLALLGAGAVGGALLGQLAAQAAELRARYKLDLRVLALAASDRVLLNDRGIDLANWQAELADIGEACDSGGGPERAAAFLLATGLPNCAVVDCTAAAAPADLYHDWMTRGLHVVTPNKEALAGPLARYDSLRRLARASYSHFYYEATVGAGLPVIATIKHLRETGDRLVRVQGVLSDTLSLVFNAVNRGARFSAAVRDAMARGYTDADLRHDLSGADTARKVLILARESGACIDADAVAVQSLLPADMAALPTAELLARLPELDEVMATRAAAASDHGKELHYVGTVHVAERRGSVALEAFAPDHAFSQLTGADNAVAFWTERYAEQALIVRGPGAGAEVTAGGVFSDILHLSSYLGAPL